MENRRYVLEEFEKNKEYFEQKTSRGIENNRKGDVKINLKDRTGRPVTNAEIQIEQKSHEFRFGANIFMLDELETEEKNEKYKKYFAETFNMATLPFFWIDNEPVKGKTRYAKNSEKIYRRPPIDLCMEFCEKHGIEPREHGLAYDLHFPEWLYGAPTETVKKELERRFAEIAERYAGKIRTIEVTNEAEHKYYKIPFYVERDYAEWCFKTAEKYFPGNQLVINEQPKLAWEDRCRPSDKYFSYIEANMLKGARIDAVGMQYHLFNKAEVEYEKTRSTLNPVSLWEHMDLYSQFGKPLQVTEISLPAYTDKEEDELIQAEMLEKLYKIWFAHPNMEQIIYWNLVDGYTYVDKKEKVEGPTMGNMSVGENYYRAGLIRFDLSPKPAFIKLKELIEKEWHTSAVSKVNAAGSAFFRAFYGDYDIKVTTENGTFEGRYKISSKKDNTIDIVL